MIASFITQDGLSIWLDSLHVYGTYSGWLLGGPKPSQMFSLRQQWVKQARSLYQSWPVFCNATTDPLSGMLPEFVCIGYCRASPRDPQMHGSALVIVWFQQGSPADRVTMPVLSEAEWWGAAKDFED